MTDNSGILSVDFLVGFTIFMVAFIWVATLVPNLFLGVSSHGVDFDAVAYRTSVILAEDPGATKLNCPDSWEFQPDTDNGKNCTARFGLAVSKETPNILSEIKVKKFFCSTESYPGGFSYPDDYRNKLIFGDYPYRFNISLQEVGESNTSYVGDILPVSNYGYIRREVKIKHFSNATIDRTDYNEAIIEKSAFNNTQNVTFHDFSIKINTTRLLHGNITDPVINPNYDMAYQIDPRTDWINITIKDLNKTPPRYNWMPSGPIPSAPIIGDREVNLSKVTFHQTRYGFGGMFDIPQGTVPQQNYTYDDGNQTPVNWPVDLEENVTFAFPPGFFSGAYDDGTIYINLTFGVDQAKYPRGLGFLNNTRTRPWEYDYNPVNVTQPALRDAVLEVAVW
jgi:hypothetical protein